MEAASEVPEGGFAAVLGIEIEDHEEGRVTARLPIRPELLQPFGIVHGGVLCSLAESITSYATYMAVATDGKVAQGQANDTSFLRPLLEGTIHAVAVARHRGRTTWVWDVEMRDDAGRLCALSRMTVAVREMPGPR